ncbi:MAG: hypothetical protein ACT4PG_13655 [Panacagrimonas sp.]
MMRLVLLMACCGLSGCGVSAYCLVKQDYQSAEVVPELRPADGLAIPNSPSAMRLPPKPAQTVPFGTRAEDGSGVCLDKPPRLKVVPAAAETSTES